MIKKTDISQVGKNYFNNKIEMACSYYNLFIGIILLLPLAVSQLCFDAFINFIVCLPFFLLFFLASYSGIKELAIIVGYYLLVLFVYRFDFSLFGILIIIYKILLIIGIVFNSLSVYLESKCKDGNNNIVDNDQLQQNRNGKKFRDL